MFLLTSTSNYRQKHFVNGVFTTIEKAQHFVENVMGRGKLVWSNNAADSTLIWVNGAGDYLKIQPVDIDPT